ncbi:hypothetical protein [Marinobacterium lutimaris]|uniref:Uncharacterized protein n=1 Tax=Marinobacterium lutimaris TaxID=568106 RepID=A0A1H5U2U8_9GAMM|nr:hypothetical protein [Marinobacterium lutimaris]SEF69363.1 hypothetical protein SAMN05444390_101247 [Marinobacterium lutimaris]
MDEQQTSPAKGGLRLILPLAITLCAALFFVVALPKLLTPETPEAIELTPPTCDIAQGQCTLRQDGIELTFELTPRPPSSASPMTASLTTQGINPTRVSLSLEGRDMYMGLNQTELQPAAAELWQGETQLAVCTTGSMIWRALILIETENKSYRTWFDFEAK